MSEDEIIDKINYMIDNWHRNVVEIDIQWIQGLLDLYQQEKEKNKELSNIKECIKILQNSSLIDEQYIVIANHCLKNTNYKHLLDDYINKDKIKEKIEEFCEKDKNPMTVDMYHCYYQFCTRVLQELLEEE